MESRAQAAAIAFPSRISTGPVESAFPDLAAQAGWRRVAVIAGTAVSRAHDTVAALAAVTDATVAVFDRGPAHVPFASVERLTAEIGDFRPDVVVSVGGGSSHDAAKGVAVLLEHGGQIVDYCLTYEPPDVIRTVPLPGRHVPIVTIPTTLAGSEANGAAGFSSGSGKRVLSAPSLTPFAVLVDGTILATTPKEIFLGSAMNALNHCVEALASRRRHAVPDLVLPAAFRELADSTAQVGRGEATTEAYERAGVASALTGAALLGTWLGVAHAAGHVIGARYGVPHGWCHAVLAGAAIRYNAPVMSDAHGRAARALDIEETSAALADWMDARAVEWGLPQRLSELGVPEDEIAEVAVATWHDHDTYFNPRASTPSDLEELLRSVW